MSDIKVIKLRGEVKEGVTLLDLKRQSGEIYDFKEIVVCIATIGGSVAEGLEIMMWFNEMSEKGITVITLVDANAYSIGSMIMLAGDVRLVSIHSEGMVHNPMLPELSFVNANDLQLHIDKLRKLESNMHSIYQMFTNLPLETIKSLMDKETFLSPDDMIKYNFADTIVDIKKVAYDVPEETKPENKLTNIKNMSKNISNSLNRVLATINQLDVVNQSYSTEGSGEIEITQSDKSKYTVGDKTDIEKGKVVLGDGNTVVIEDYIIVDIIKEVKEIKEEIKASNEGSAPIKEDKDLKAIADDAKEDDAKNVVVSEVSRWETEVINTDFSLGQEIKYKADEGKEPKAVGAGEYQLEDDTIILTDSKGIVRWSSKGDVDVDEVEVEETKEDIKEDSVHKDEVKEDLFIGEEPVDAIEAEITEETKEEEEKKEDPVAEVEEEVKEEKKEDPMALILAELQKMNARVADLEMGKEKIDERMTKTEAISEKISETVEAVATTTTSNFLNIQPQSKGNVMQIPSGMTTFQKAKWLAANRG